MIGDASTPLHGRANSIGVGALRREYEGAVLGDARRSRRLAQIAMSAAENPALSFPKLTRSSAELEALYRWFGNGSFTASDVLDPHMAQTRARSRSAKSIRVVHDTTDLVFKGERDDLGIVEGEAMGFFAHTAISIGPGDLREPLGVLGLNTYVRQDTKARRKLSNSQVTKLARETPRAQKISHRWEALALQVAGELPADVEAIHVMDQEADDYVVFATLLQHGLRFVIRAHEGRRLRTGGDTIEDALASSEQMLFRTVRLEHRLKKKPEARYRKRDERDAQLSIRWGQIKLTRTKDAQSEVPEVNLFVVRVHEPSPPEGEQAVDWTLVTSDPVTTLEDAARIVDHYRARWTIEEFFKALKTGCAIEQRQLMTYGGLTKALAVYIPIAWEMLRLRCLARAEPDAPATRILSKEDLAILRAILSVNKTDYVWPRRPTVHDVLLGIARLGGHLPRNGDPGWITIGRGFEDLNNARRVWLLAQSKM